MSDLAIPSEFLTFCRHLVIAGGLGMAVGLERERSSHAKGGAGIFAGIRTFSIGGMMGCIAGILADKTHPLLFAAVFTILGVICAISYYRDMDDRPGVTTEAAFLLVFLLGGMVHTGAELQAAVVTIALTALLQYRATLRDFAERVSHNDVAAALKFGLVSLVVLPLVPNQTWDPWRAFNPYKTWLMVVLISGLSFVGYILVQALGPRAGIGLTGLLGGLVSSTATTNTFSLRSRDEGAGPLLPHYALAAALACTVMYPRLIIEAAVVNRSFAGWLLLPLGTALVVGAAMVWWLYRTAGRGEAAVTPGLTPKLKNPVEIWPAIKFALLFAVVLFVFKFVQKEFGSGAVLLAAFLSGLTDTDAVLLSMADAVQDGSISVDVALASVVVACTANSIVKGLILWRVGVPGFRGRAAAPLVAMAVGAALGYGVYLALGRA